jgi:hypothetical protein
MNFVTDFLIGWNVASAQRKLSVIAETSTWTEEMKAAYQAEQARVINERKARNARLWPFLIGVFAVMAVLAFIGQALPPIPGN